MPSVWNLVGVEARTALTVFVFQISTASGGTAVGFGGFAEATDSDAVTATVRAPTRMRNAFIFTVLLLFLPVSGRDRLYDADRIEPGTLRGKRSLASRRGVEHEEADLVFGNVDRLFEADARLLLRQLLCGRACPPLETGPLADLVTSEVGLDEVARHALHARTKAAPWKRQNI